MRFATTLILSAFAVLGRPISQSPTEAENAVLQPAEAAYFENGAPDTPGPQTAISSHGVSFYGAADPAVNGANAVAYTSPYGSAVFSYTNGVDLSYINSLNGQLPPYNPNYLSTDQGYFVPVYMDAEPESDDGRQWINPNDDYLAWAQRLMQQDQQLPAEAAKVEAQD